MKGPIASFTTTKADLSRPFFIAIVVGFLVHPTEPFAADPRLNKQPAPSAAETRLAKQVDYLQRQVAFLEKELGALKLMIKRAPDGSMLVTANPNKQEQIQRNESIDVGVNRQLQIGDSHSIEIGRDQTQSVGQNMTLEVGKDLNVAAARRMLFNSGDQLVLKSGHASITLKKNGDIEIKGKTIAIQGSGRVIIKGPNVNID
ncbi:hypothetical protein ACFL3A_07825 [Pseudomonadota bacterium]